MYFLIAVALWICIACVYTHDKSRRKKSDKAFTEWSEQAKTDYHMFVELYAASDELLSQTESRVYSNKPEACAMRGRIKCEAGINPTSDMIVRALLAQSCKVPRKTADGGIRLLSGYQPGRESEKKFLIWYDNELRLHGFPYELLYVSWDKVNEFCHGRNMSVAIPISKHPQMTSGECIWQPVRLFTPTDIVLTQQSSPAK